MVQEGTKDVTTAQERTDPSVNDMLIMVNGETKQVMQVPVGKLPTDGNAAPADFNDIFGL